MFPLVLENRKNETDEAQGAVEIWNLGRTSFNRGVNFDVEMQRCCCTFHEYPLISDSERTSWTMAVQLMRYRLCLDFCRVSSRVQESKLRCDETFSDLGSAEGFGIEEK